MVELELPFVICGEVKEGRDTCLSFNRDKDYNLFLPSLCEDDITQIASIDSIGELSVREIISFLCEAGRLWRNREYRWRTLASEIASVTTGYSKQMIDLSYDMLSEVLNEDFLLRLLEVEMRDIEFLDRWVKLGEADVHAVPLGRILHVLAGNVPLVSLVSYLMGILTKNSNVLKIPTGDPATSVCLCLTFREIDPSHPVTKTSSAVYVEHDSDYLTRLFEIADGVCAWGGGSAIEACRRKCRPGTPFLDFGPRKSLQFISREIYADDKDLKTAALKAAQDLVMYDQHACHSPQIAFVESPAELFCRALVEALNEVETFLPRGYTSIEEKAQITLEKTMALFSNGKVYCSRSKNCTIILSPEFRRGFIHPLSRTLFVVEVEKIEDAVHFIDSSVLVVAFSSEEKQEELKDEVVSRGAHRLTVLGKMARFPIGYPQEGRFNLSRLVRWVARDR